MHMKYLDTGKPLLTYLLFYFHTPHCERKSILYSEYPQNFQILIPFHSIHESSYSMEAQLVHFNSKYGNFKTAVTKKDGVVVVAFFVQVSEDEASEYFGKITDQIQQFTKYIQKLRWTQVMLFKLISSLNFFSNSNQIHFRLFTMDVITRAR